MKALVANQLSSKRKPLTPNYVNHLSHGDYTYSGFAKASLKNWAQFVDSDSTYNNRLGLKACGRRLLAIANDKRFSAEQQNLNDLYEALSVRSPEMTIV